MYFFGRGEKFFHREPLARCPCVDPHVAIDSPILDFVKSGT
jgi:hypothetical protein